MRQRTPSGAPPARASRAPARLGRRGRTPGTAFRARGDPAGGDQVRRAGAHERDVVQRALDRRVALPTVGPGVGAHVHGGRAHLAGELRDHPRRVPGPQDQRAVEVDVQGGQAVEQEAAAGIAGGAPEPVVDHEHRDDVTVRAGRVTGGEQRGVVVQSEVAPEPEQRRGHRPSVGGRTSRPARSAEWARRVPRRYRLQRKSATRGGRSGRRNARSWSSCPSCPRWRRWPRSSARTPSAAC